MVSIQELFLIKSGLFYMSIIIKSGMKNFKIKSIERKPAKIETGIALFVKRATEA